MPRPALSGRIAGFLAALMLTSMPAFADVVTSTHGCDQDSNWYYLQFYNRGSDAVDLNVCVVTDGSAANNYYDRLEGESYSKVFWIGTCDHEYRWYWTEDGSTDPHCR
jgi:hypothetical protein